MLSVLAMDQAKAGDLDTTFVKHTISLSEQNHSIVMVPVSGGTLTMTDPATSSDIKVQIDSFWMSSFEITWDLYNEFRDEVIEDLMQTTNLSNLPYDAISIPSPAYVDMTWGMGSDGYPAISMTQYAAHMFTRWLTAKTGRFFRLPTEAEWEYACKGGQNKDSNKIESVDKFAWHRDNSQGKYQQVGTKTPNSLGLYNMLGNVGEWTADQYIEHYVDALIDGQQTQNPWLKPTELYPRTVKGGSWMDPSSMANCSSRRGSEPNWKMHDPQLPKSLWWHTNALFLGFRIVEPKNQPATIEEMSNYWIEEIQDYY
jgi:formylglycine-generating enzyme required for sulfatase activity